MPEFKTIHYNNAITEVHRRIKWQGGKVWQLEATFYGPRHIQNAALWIRWHSDKD